MATPISTEVGAVLDEVGKRLGPIVDKVGGVLGPTAQHVWAILVRQQIVEAFTLLASTLLLIAVWSVGLRFGLRYLRRTDWSEDEGVIPVTVFLAGGAVLIVGLLVSCVTTGAGHFINPEYYALQTILRALTGK